MKDQTKKSLSHKLTGPQIIALARARADIEAAKNQYLGMLQMIVASEQLPEAPGGWMLGPDGTEIVQAAPVK